MYLQPFVFLNVTGNLLKQFTTIWVPYFRRQRTSLKRERKYEYAGIYKPCLMKKNIGTCFRNLSDLTSDLLYHHFAVQRMNSKAQTKREHHYLYINQSGFDLVAFIGPFTVVHLHRRPDRKGAHWDLKNLIDGPPVPLCSTD